MSALRVRGICESYLSLIFEGTGDPRADESRLERLLDELALVRHELEFEVDPASYADPPKRDIKELYAHIAKRFPDLGLYNEALSVTTVGESAIGIGDAIDDLADITRDLMDVVWRFETTSAADALEEFQLGYATHWGEHLRGLQRYLFELRRTL